MNKSVAAITTLAKLCSSISDVAQISNLPGYITSKILYKNTGALTLCWEWQGEINRNGYGRLWVNGERIMSHVHMYKLSGKEFKVGRKIKYVIDHLCENRRCCNPDHLQQVEESINLKRRYRRVKRA